jgi:cell division protein FtsL
VAVPARRVGQPSRRPVMRAVPAAGTRPRKTGSTVARRRIPFLLFAIAVVTAMVVGVVSAQTLVAQGSFRLQELSERADRLEAGFGRLRLRADRLASLDRIEEVGRRAGLEPAARYYPLTVPEPRASASGPSPGLGGAARARAAIGDGG